MSGPYRTEAGAVYWIVVGPTRCREAFKYKQQADDRAGELNAAYAAGQAGGGDRIAALETTLERLTIETDALLTAVSYASEARIMLPRKSRSMADVDAALENARALLPPQTSTRDGG
jgi:hypothetical protein